MATKILKLQDARDLLEEFSPELHSNVDTFPDLIGVSQQFGIELGDFPHIPLGTSRHTIIPGDLVLVHYRFKDLFVHEIGEFFFDHGSLLAGLHDLIPRLIDVLEFSQLEEGVVEMKL